MANSAVEEKKNTTKMGQSEEGPQEDELLKSLEEDDTKEEFITLPKPRPFTRAKKDSIERRPAAVLNFCHFLTNVSAKCKAELVKLGCTRQHHAGLSGSSWDKRMMRLKIYQRAFSAIVMHFKAYSPVLFHIKKNYEDMLNYRLKQLKASHYEKKKINAQKNAIKRQLLDYQFPEISQLHKSESYLGVLRQKISLQEEAIKVITGILRKLEECLSDHFERHRDLEEQIVMVDTEITSRRQKAFSLREKEEKEMAEKEAEAGAAAAKENAALGFLETDDEDMDDPFYNVPVEEIDEERKMVWIMAFAICHKDLEEAERRLSMYQIKYQYVVPRHEHENMKKAIVDEKISAKTLADDRFTLEEELSTLKELEEKLKEEVTDVDHQLADLRTLVTPRPSWEQLGEFIQGGVPKWEKMVQGKSTKDVTDRLFSELRSKKGGEKYLQPLGIEPTVLRCLRHTKKVSDRQLHYRDAALLIHDIWQLRKKVLEENFNNPKKESEYSFGREEVNLALKSFADFVALYFEERYEDVDQRMEWTYNLVEACKRFSLDYRLTQFLNVLQGRADEGLYTITRNELFRVRNTFLQKSIEENPASQGTMPANMYVDVLEHTFPQKEEAQYQAMVRVTNKLNAELNPGEDADLSVYHITQLIDTRDDGFRGALVTEIVKQFELVRQAYIDRIIEELANVLGVTPEAAMSESDSAGNKDVSIIQMYYALLKGDKDMDDEKAGPALAWIFTGTSVMPGGGLKPTRLLQYVKLHNRGDGEGNPAAEAGQGGDDEKFEKAIQDVLHEDDEDEDNQMNESQKKAFYRAQKTARLRNVVKRLRNSALLPASQIYDPKFSLLPEESINLETDLEGLRGAMKEAIAEIPDADDNSPEEYRPSNATRQSMFAEDNEEEKEGIEGKPAE